MPSKDTVLKNGSKNEIIISKFKGNHYKFIN